MIKSKKENLRKKNILIAHGVNLDLLGKREPHIYGTLTLEQINSLIKKELVKLVSIVGLEVRCEFYQSNSEGEFLHKLSARPWDGVIINPGAWGHTSLALADRLKGLALPFVEVHLSNVFSREQFRQHSYLSPHARGVITGFGADSYLGGLYLLMKQIV